MSFLTKLKSLFTINQPPVFPPVFMPQPDPRAERALVTETFDNNRDEYVAQAQRPPFPKAATGKVKKVPSKPPGRQPTTGRFNTRATLERFITQKRAKGWTHAAIARQAGVNTVTVSRVLRSRGVA